MGVQESGHESILGLGEPAPVLDAARAVDQVSLEPRGPRRLERTVDPVGDQALCALTPAASRKRMEPSPQRLARPGKRVGQLVAG